jgi:hypothetical protein
VRFGNRIVTAPAAAPTLLEAARDAAAAVKVLAPVSAAATSRELPQGADSRRERIPIVVDSPLQQRYQRRPFIIGQPG